MFYSTHTHKAAAFIVMSVDMFDCVSLPALSSFTHTDCLWEELLNQGIHMFCTGGQIGCVIDILGGLDICDLACKNYGIMSIKV